MASSIKRALVLLLLVLPPALMAQIPRRPRGIYAIVSIDGDIDQQQKANPSITPDCNGTPTWLFHFAASWSWRRPDGLGR